LVRVTARSGSTLIDSASADAATGNPDGHNNFRGVSVDVS
jgi:hypothetical protein